MEQDTEMATLRTSIGFNDADGFYQQLIELHHGLSERESHALNARLLLLLANHIGDEQVLGEAMRRARAAGSEPAAD